MIAPVPHVSPDALDPPAEWLLQVPGCEGGERPRAVLALGAGEANRAWRIETRVGRFVLKGPRGRPAPGTDPRRAFDLHALAAGAGFAPRLVRAGAAPANESTTFFVTEWVDGTPFAPADMQDGARLGRLAERLAALHALSAPPRWRFEFESVARGYGASDAEWEAIARDVASADCGARPPAIVHLDLHHANILEAGPIVLLDWEYAAVGDPLLDFASWIASYPEAARRAPDLLERGRLGAVATPEQLLALARAYGQLNALWQRALGERRSGDPRPPRAS